MTQPSTCPGSLVANVSMPARLTRRRPATSDGQIESRRFVSRLISPPRNHRFLNSLIWGRNSYRNESQVLPGSPVPFAIGSSPSASSRLLLCRIT
jgi:hypothetical protein